MTMNRRIKCQSEGCPNEVLFKTHDGAFDDRRGSGGRSPLSPHDRHSTGPLQVSPYCKQHTCIHFYGDERCIYKKPPHDTVCAIHARCPVPNCYQARAQYLAPNFDPLSNAAPRYARYEVCSDHKCTIPRCPASRASSRTTFCQAHACQAEGCARQRQDQRNCCVEHQCKTRGCRTIVEGEFPHCAIHIKCQMSGCGESRHFSAKAKDYLAYCTNHTCRSQKCHEYVDRLALFCGSHGCAKPKCHQEALAERLCIDHFKEHYIVQGKRQAHGRRHTNSRPDQNPKREDEQLHDALNNNIRPDTAGDSSDDETLESRPIAIAGNRQQ
ncbi:uncharacterized protein B0T15DRAFT_229234 [Chaetomium strumarium]|uniref:Uncharacterized protein n=1 Tax=Chaetomium strumarium TaxID=1170767 RepID=A0AAJ0M042_9PEZI|nr:hypothetical protein B0T15DRAFT_229234 [Chaetomium strumarium]